MTTKYFLKNNLNSVLSTRDGTLDIPPYGFAPIREVDCENLTILYALERKWAEIVNEEPTPVTEVKSGVEIEITKPYEGLTFEELQAEKAAKAAETAEAPTQDSTPVTKGKKGK